MRAPVICFASKLMRIPMKPLFALLLAVLLPVRGFTFTTHCEPHGQGGDAHASRQAESALQCPHHADDKGASHTHGCGDCCGGAAVLNAPRFTMPRAAAALIVGRLARPHPALAIDRLDRPPRQPAC
jgi:hypothetical protein